jgi:hypothetical protein
MDAMSCIAGFNRYRTGCRPQSGKQGSLWLYRGIKMAETALTIIKTTVEAIVSLSRELSESKDHGRVFKRV